MKKTIAFSCLTLAAVVVSFVATRLYSQSRLAALPAMHSVEQMLLYKDDGTLDHVLNFEYRRFEDASYIQTTGTSEHPGDHTSVFNLQTRQAMMIDGKTGVAEVRPISDRTAQRQQNVLKNCIENISPRPDTTLAQDTSPRLILGYPVVKITAVSNLPSGTNFTNVYSFAPDLGCALMEEQVYKGNKLINHRTVVSLEVTPQDRSVLSPPTAQIVSHEDYEKQYGAARNNPGR